MQNFIPKIYHCCVYSEKFLTMDRGTVRNMQNFIPKIYHCCVYSEKFLMMDRGTVRNMQNFIPKINLRNQCIQLALLQDFITMHGHLNVINDYLCSCGVMKPTLDNRGRGVRLVAGAKDFFRSANRSYRFSPLPTSYSSTGGVFPRGVTARPIIRLPAVRR